MGGKEFQEEEKGSQTLLTANDLCQKCGQAVSSPSWGVVKGRSRVVRVFEWFRVPTTPGDQG